MQPRPRNSFRRDSKGRGADATEDEQGTISPSPRPMPDNGRDHRSLGVETTGLAARRRDISAEALTRNLLIRQRARKKPADCFLLTGKQSLEHAFSRRCYF